MGGWRVVVLHVSTFVCLSVCLSVCMILCCRLHVVLLAWIQLHLKNLNSVF